MGFDEWEQQFMGVLFARRGLAGEQLSVTSAGSVFGKWIVTIKQGADSAVNVRIIEAAVGATSVAGQMFPFTLASDPFASANEVADWMQAH